MSDMENKLARPLIPQRADPFVYRHDNGMYYFTASVPAFDLIVLRCSPTLEGLKDAEEKIVWRMHESGPMSLNIWAPEIHYVCGKWYIYFAASQKDGRHRMYALENASEDPMQGEFVEKGQINTGWESFTLDATTFTCKGVDYWVWAQQEPGVIPGNSNLYIARMIDGLTLQLPAARLTIPEYDWECQGYLVNEGPSVLEHNGMLYMTYSASATDERYAMGLLTASVDSDLTDPASWTKSPVPVMVSEPERGLYGPGHNSFTKDENGRDVLVFHARPYPGFKGTPLSDPNRHCFLRYVQYDENDRPVFAAGENHEMNWPYV